MVVAASTVPAVSATEPVTTSRRESLVILVSLALRSGRSLRAYRDILANYWSADRPRQGISITRVPASFRGRVRHPFLASRAAHNQRFTTGGGADRLLSRSDRKAV